MIRIVAVLVIAACGAPQVRPEEDLTESIHQFNEGIRWGRFGVAASSIPPGERSKFIDEMDQLTTDLKITDYEIINVEAHGPREARVQLKITWYKDPENIVRETSATQTWERHGKIWMMVDETRLRGAEMPGLAEKVTER
jgi:hypothetical protein